MKKIINTSNRVIQFGDNVYEPGAVIEVTGKEGNYGALRSIAKALKLTIIEEADAAVEAKTTKKTTKKAETTETTATTE